MSDWNRGREDDQRRYRGDDRRDWGARNRGSDDDQRNWERRSFEDQGRGSYRGGDWREAERRRGPGSEGFGASGSQRYGQSYGQGGERSSGSQDYGSQNYGSGAYRASGGAYGAGAYGSQGYGGQGYGAYGSQQGGAGSRDRQPYGEEGRRWNRERSDFMGDNEPLQRVSEGEADRGPWSNLGRGEHRGRGPKNYTRSDERIREDVNDRLSDDAWLDASEIEVQVNSCEVTLTGTVTSREDRRRAEDIAEQVSGVKHVQNNLRVEQQQGGLTAGAQESTSPSRGAGSQLS